MRVKVTKNSFGQHHVFFERTAELIKPSWRAVAIAATEDRKDWYDSFCETFIKETGLQMERNSEVIFEIKLNRNKATK